VITSPIRPPAPTGTGHRHRRPARPPKDALRRFTLVRHHRAPTASFRPALTEARQRNQPPADRPVHSGPRPCLIDVGFPLSGPQDRTSTSDLKRHARHTAPLRSPTARCASRPPAPFVSYSNIVSCSVLALGTQQFRGHDRLTRRWQRGRSPQRREGTRISRTPNPRRACSFESFIRSRPASLTAARSAAAAISPVRRPPE
jgi:hypothetical protein